MHKPKEDFEDSTNNPDPDFKPHTLLGVTIFSDTFGIVFPIGVSFTGNASATRRSYKWAVEFSQAKEEKVLIKDLGYDEIQDGISRLNNKNWKI